MTIFSTGSVRVSAKTDYAIRAAIELATAGDSSSARTAQEIADAQQVPLRFLLNILADLRRVGLVDSRRGPHGGWWLSRPAGSITVADVIRAVDGPLSEPTNARPGETAKLASAASVDDLWAAVHAGIRDILERITVADLATGDLPGATAV
ncbi:MAG TPA: Rrf2 family transcriptional regulator [Mycobacteriales bacterium]|nr:Rrf2 family transcriptional regulator [Mycobacteriales bacterium]